jgi:hypothetical protein
MVNKLKDYSIGISTYEAAYRSEPALVVFSARKSPSSLGKRTDAEAPAGAGAGAGGDSKRQNTGAQKELYKAANGGNAKADTDEDTEEEALPEATQTQGGDSSSAGGGERSSMLADATQTQKDNSSSAEEEA